MTTSQEPETEAHPSFRPMLDEADPLLRLAQRETVVEARQVIVRQGDALRAAHLLVNGLACRYRVLRNGRRQITAVIVPGDVCDLDAMILGQAPCFVEAITPCILGEISGISLDEFDGKVPEVRKAIRRQLLRNEAIMREWMVGMGRLGAKERLAHFLCEFRERLMRVGLSDGNTYDFPLTQNEFADVLGLSTVHVNRVLQELRKDELIEFKGRVLHIVDHAALAILAGFDPTYLKSA